MHLAHDRENQRTLEETRTTKSGHTLLAEIQAGMSRKQRRKEFLPGQLRLQWPKLVTHKEDDDDNEICPETEANTKQ
jgi:hypothetical protein